MISQTPTQTIVQETPLILILQRRKEDVHIERLQKMREVLENCSEAITSQMRANIEGVREVRRVVAVEMKLQEERIDTTLNETTSLHRATENVLRDQLRSTASQVADTHLRLVASEARRLEKEQQIKRLEQT